MTKLIASCISVWVSIVLTSPAALFCFTMADSSTRLFCTGRSNSKREKLKESQDEQPEFPNLNEPLPECTLSFVHAIGNEVRKTHCIIVNFQIFQLFICF